MEKRLLYRQFETERIVDGHKVVSRIPDAPDKAFVPTISEHPQGGVTINMSHARQYARSLIEALPKGMED